MNSNNDISKILRKQNQWTIDDLKNDIDEIPYLSPANITTNNQDESFVGNNNSGILYKDNILSDTGSNISSFTPRRESFALSDSESSTSSLLIPSNIRRRALSTSSRPKDRYSMHELGSAKIDDNSLTRKFLSPTRHSMAFDNGFSINNMIVENNSFEDREWNIDRERIGNAGKGFGNLINDESRKGSIADLIADVKDEDAVELALITQRNADQKNRIHHTEMDIEKDNTKKDGNLNIRFHPSETTLSNSRMCKQFLENKYHVLFKIINNNGVYNPLQIIKNRRIDIASDGANHSLGSSEKSSGGSSSRLISNIIKPRKALLHHKETSIWDVSHMEIIKDYEQINKFDQVLLNKQMSSDNGYETNSEVGIYINDNVASESDEHKKRLKYRRLSQIFIPPTHEMQAMSPQGGIRSNSGQPKKTTHSRALSLNNIAAASQGKEDSHGKSKRWSIHLFKRKDKKHKNESSSSDISIIQEAPDCSITSQTNAKSSSDSSSGDQTSRNSMEEVRFSSEKGKDPLRHEDKTYKDEEIYYKNGVKHEKIMSKLSGDKNNDQLSVDDWSDIAQSRDSEDTDNSNHSSTIHSVDFESDVVVNDAVDVSRRNTAGYLNVEDHYGKFLGDEQHVDNRLSRSSSENKTAEDSTGSDEEYEEEIVGKTIVGGETVLVNLDILPQELVDLVAEQGIVGCSTKNGHFVELDVGLNELFKFRKLIGYGVDLLDLQISLVYDDPEDGKSLNQQDADKIIKEYDERIEETTKFIEENKMLLTERDDYISKNSRTFEHLDVPFVLSPTSNIREFTFDKINRHNPSPSQSIMAECKLNIDEGIELLSDKLVKIESKMNKLEKQHSNFSEEMRSMQYEIEEMTSDINNDYFHELKILEDEIHLLIAEKGKSPWIDVFYLMMSYVLAGKFD
ncbi:12492_t:CDS:10 [Funneliformis mosseae]|uniref:12492_t:CDS:1 n=1 Tax=Funneliformis mosseae TaxID=27381 RepID=A0A9N9G9T7_FUNMO|nr:12492_t:CDS:10 [Funneliformis mosseae]